MFIDDDEETLAHKVLRIRHEPYLEEFLDHLSSQDVQQLCKEGFNEAQDVVQLFRTLLKHKKTRKEAISSIIQLISKEQMKGTTSLVCFSEIHTLLQELCEQDVDYTKQLIIDLNNMVLQEDGSTDVLNLLPTIIG